MALSPVYPIKVAPMALNRNLAYLQRAASIPLIGQIVTLVVEVPLKLLAMNSSRFRETSIGSFYHYQVTSSALVASLVIPVVGPVISQIAYRKFDKDRANMTQTLIMQERVEDVKHLVSSCTLTNENIQNIVDRINSTEFLNKNIKSEMLRLLDQKVLKDR